MMGGTTYLPVISMSSSPFRFPHPFTKSQTFLNKVLSAENVQLISAYEILDSSGEKSDSKHFLMCDHCPYSSESKGQLFEHFIKSHVFLCSLCTYVGVCRSSVLQHCFQSHSKIMEDKLENVMVYEFDTKQLLTEIDISSKGFGDIYKSSSSKGHDKYELDRDEEMSNSSLLSGNRNNSTGRSESDSDFDPSDTLSHRKRKRKWNYEQKQHSDVPPTRNDNGNSGLGARDNIDNFLSRANSPGMRAQDQDNLNVYSDTDPMDMFFSGGDAQTDPNLSESIFHDHKEMFMVSRLPFPLRQDDSPNDPFNETSPQPETASILHSILSKDKQESSSESKSPLPEPAKEITSGVAVDSKDSSFSHTATSISDISDIKLEVDVDFDDTKAHIEAHSDNNQLTTNDIQKSFSTSYSRADQEEVPTVTSKMQTLSSVYAESTLGKAKIFTNVLEKTCDVEESQSMETLVPAEKINMESFQASLSSVKNPSDMSLLELLSMDTPFPISNRTSQTKRRSSSTSSDISSVTSLVCDSCHETFKSRSVLESHFENCKTTRNPSDDHVSKRKVRSYQPGPSSRRTDLSSISERLPKSTRHFYSERMPALNQSRFPRRCKLLSKRNLKLKRKIQDFSALTLKFKQARGIYDTIKMKPASRPLDQILKRKIERNDDEYEPESESSESSDNEGTSCFRQRKRAMPKRPSQNHSFGISKKNEKLLRNTMLSKLVQEPISKAKEKCNSVFSSSQDSSLSSSVSSSLSFTSSSIPPVTQTADISNSSTLTSSPKPSSSQNLSSEFGTATKLSKITEMTKANFGTKNATGVGKKSLSVPMRNKSPTKSLLHSLLISPHKGTMIGKQNTKKYPQSLNPSATNNPNSGRDLHGSSEKPHFSRLALKSSSAESKLDGNSNKQDSYSSSSVKNQGSSFCYGYLDKAPTMSEGDLGNEVKEESKEMKIEADDNLSKEMKRASSPDGRLSASMMDVPDPPTHAPLIQRSSSLRSMLSPLRSSHIIKTEHTYSATPNCEAALSNSFGQSKESKPISDVGSSSREMIFDNQQSLLRSLLMRQTGSNSSLEGN